MIDFKKEDWLKAYIEYREKYPPEIPIPALPELLIQDTNLQVDNDHLTYYTIQPTGFLYGFPVNPPLHLPDKESDSFRSLLHRAKFIILEVMISALIIHRSGPDEENLLKEGYFEEITGILHDYFLFPYRNSPEKDKISFEMAFNEKLKYPQTWFKQASLGINSLLFWDIYFLILFQKKVLGGAENKEEILEALYDEKQRMKALTIEYVIVASHASGVLEKEEITLFEQFIKTSELSEEKMDELKETYRKGLPFDKLDTDNLSWLARRYLFDVSMLVVYADRILTREEEQHLKKLTGKLNLHAEEFEESQGKLGLFMLRYGEYIPFLKGKMNPLQLVQKSVTKSTKSLLNAFKSEGIETADMAVTFGKVLAQKLRIADREDMPSEAEIKQAINQLKDIPKFAPFFGIVFFPVPGVTELYLLLALTVEKLSGNKVSVLPSNFSNLLKNKEDKDSLPEYPSEEDQGKS